MTVDELLTALLELHSERPHPLLTRSRAPRYASDDLGPVCSECSGDDDPHIDQVAYPCPTVELVARFRRS